MMKNFIKKLLLISIILMPSIFTLAQIDPPTNLTATVALNDVGLTWENPTIGELFEIAYDDGDHEGGLIVGSAGEEDRYMALRLTMPEDGDVQEIAIYANSAGGFDFDFVMVSADDGTGLPDLNSPYENFGTITITNTSYEWILLTLTNPINFLAGDDFWIVLHWPLPNTIIDGPWIGSDTSIPPVENRNYYLSSSGSWTLYTSGNVMMRAYYSLPGKNYSGNGIKIINGSKRKEATVPVYSLSGENMKLSTTSNSFSSIQTNKSTKDLLGYNVYRNSNLIEFVTDESYIDYDVESGTYEYYVTAVYDEGESDPSNMVNIEIEDMYMDCDNFDDLTVGDYVYPLYKPRLAS